MWCSKLVWSLMTNWATRKINLILISLTIVLITCNALGYWHDVILLHTGTCRTVASARWGGERFGESHH